MKLAEIQVVGVTSTGKSTIANVISKLLDERGIASTVFDETDPVNILAEKPLNELLDRLTGQKLVIRIRQLNRNGETK